MANRFFPNAGHFYSTHNMPVQIDCNFIVDHTNGNGLGIRSLKGPGILNVFMNTNQTPGLGNGGITNPNPAVGTILVQFLDNYNRIISSSYALVAPVGASQIITSGLTAGTAYVITVLGDALLADWQAIGVPKGLTPAVGLSFIASSTGAGASATARVAPSAATGTVIAQMEGVGDANLSLSPIPGQQPQAGQLIVQTRNYSNAIAAPADGSVISLNFLMSNSSVQVAGE